MLDEVKPHICHFVMYINPLSNHQSLVVFDKSDMNKTASSKSSAPVKHLFLAINYLLMSCDTLAYSFISVALSFGMAEPAMTSIYPVLVFCIPLSDLFSWRCLVQPVLTK
jgi:hypothetical protein